jgi:hypothetical protein
MSLASQLSAAITRIGEEINALRGENSGKLITSAKITASPTNITSQTFADLAGLSVTFTAPARPVKIEAFFPIVFNNTAGGGWVIILTNSANTEYTRWRDISTAANEGHAGGMWIVIDNLTPGNSYTFKIRVALANAIGTTTIFGLGAPAVAGQLVVTAF